jgi:septal ring factor EnvC (AmiA/AmiB activator)
MKYYISILFLIGLCTFSSAQTKSELEQKKQAAQNELKVAKELLDKTQVQKQSSLKRLAVLNRGIRSRSSLIETISKEIKLLDIQIDEIEAEIIPLKVDIQKGRDEYANIIYSIYKNHTEEDKLMFLMASEDINQFYQRVKYLKYLKEYRENKISELEGLMKQLEVQTAEMLKVRNSKADLLQSKEAENRSLLNERTQRNGLVRRLSQDEKRIRMQIQENERIRKEIEDKIQKIIEEEARKSSSNTLFASLTPEQKLVGNNFLQNKGRLPWPVSRGVITAEFGPVPHPVLSGVIINNNGIDISTSFGSKARSVFEGEVTSVFAILGANYAVLVRHGEYMSVYQNLIDLKVKKGDKVVTKQELGTISSDDGVAVLTLLIYKSKELQNPKPWLSK